MRWALILMVAIGTAIGSLMPVRPASAPLAAAKAANPAPVAAQTPTETVIQRDGNGQFFAHAEVNREPVRFVVDTGADMVALTLEDAQRAHVDFSPDRFVPIAHSASGIARGQAVTLDELTLDGKRVGNVRAAVIEGLPVSLLGQSYLRQIKSVQMQGDEMRLR